MYLIFCILPSHVTKSDPLLDGDFLYLSLVIFPSSLSFPSLSFCLLHSLFLSFLLVSPHVLTNSDNTSTTQSTSTDHTSSNGTTTTSSSNASGPYQYHPEIGPLPNNVPPTAYESTVLRVPQEHLHGISHDMAGHAHHSPSSASPSLYLSHTHSPCQSECFFSQHGTTPTFSSPPPPPYSPNIPPSLRNLPPSDPYHERFSPSPQSHHRDIPSSPYSSSNGTSPVLSPHQWGMLDGVGPVPLRAPPPTTTPPSSNTGIYIYNFLVRIANFLRCDILFYFRVLQISRSYDTCFFL